MIVCTALIVLSFPLSKCLFCLLLLPCVPFFVLILDAFVCLIVCFQATKTLFFQFNLGRVFNRIVLRCFKILGTNICTKDNINHLVYHLKNDSIMSIILKFK